MSAGARYPMMASYRPDRFEIRDVAVSREIKDALDEIDRLHEDLRILREALAQIAQDSLPRIHAPDGVIVRVVDQGWVLVTPTAKEPT